MKVCTQCSRSLPLDFYTKDSQKGDGLRSYCKDCQRNYASKYRQSNPDRNKIYYKQNREKLIDYQHENRERFRDVRKRWNQKNKDRNRVLAHQRRVIEKNQLGAIPENCWDLLILVYKSCGICGSEENLTMDHVIPLSLGGKHSIENLAILCKTCNSRKRNRNSFDYRTKIVTEEGGQYSIIYI